MTKKQSAARVWRALAWLAAVASVSAFQLSRPETAFAAGYYEGKTLTVVVGYKPGGGYDRYARLIGKYLPRHLPGNPTVIIQNMPGANSIIAANHVFSVAKPDGLTIGTFNNGLVIAQLTRVEGVKYDLTKLSWLGSAASDAAILALRSDLPFKTVADLRKAKEPIVIGATGPGSSTYDFPALLKEFAGLNLKLVSGYSSSADVMLAIERKEVDGRAGSYASILPYITNGLVRPLIRTRVRVPEIEKLPVDEDLATTPKGKALMAVRSAPEAIYRPFAAPPGVPADALKTLRDGFAAALRDKDLLAEAAKGKLPIDYVSAEEALKIVREVLSQPPDVAREIGKYIKFGD
ncbi:MAG TPA: tripartite tricarboxylate transporter substrate-binding protein [candidate division Zixibacteria bacterium]|nr:tripartite tricarboxylate transporter substrate-binding protein [candidate division Zixibacteria bacterium]